MKLYIKYMVSNRCKMAVKSELKKLGLHYIIAELGDVEVMEDLTADQRDQLKISLLAIGLELMDDRKSVLIGKIKSVITELLDGPEQATKSVMAVVIASNLFFMFIYLILLFIVLIRSTPTGVLLFNGLVLYNYGKQVI